MSALFTVFLGAPGAGKGTQAAAAAQALRLAHISSGDMFRRAIARDDELGRTVCAYLEKGTLVPDEITTRMVLDELKGSNQGIILDGFPRNLRQAMSLDAALGREDRALGCVIYIKVAESELLRRLSARWLCRQCQAPHTCPNGEGETTCQKCAGELYQRPDDQPETVQRRLEVYFAETAPLIAYYRDQDKLCEIDGEGEVETITQRITEVLRDGESIGCQR
ncbi:MAG: adenylate kinase [Dehalococcoidia bacterium]|nr:adenylate kinase [Dehalococcoidia bacterium]